MDQKPMDTSGVPEEIIGVPKELASEVSKEQEGALMKEATGDVVAPTPPARMMATRKTRAWEYWSS